MTERSNYQPSHPKGCPECILWKTKPYGPIWPCNERCSKFDWCMRKGMEVARKHSEFEYTGFILRKLEILRQYERETQC